MSDTDSRAGRGETKSSNYFTRSSRAEELTTDVILDVLSHRQRRIVLTYLRGADDETVAFDRLVAAVTAYERELDPDVEREEIGLHLQHQHLPKLEASDLVEYDSETDDVRYQPSERVERILEATNKESLVL